MSGERDLARLLAALRVSAREGEFVFVSVPHGDAALAVIAEASLREEEGMTYVLPRAQADARGLQYGFVAAWLTLGVHSALDAVGLTAAVSSVLARHDIRATCSPARTTIICWSRPTVATTHWPHWPRCPHPPRINSSKGCTPPCTSKPAGKGPRSR